MRGITECFPKPEDQPFDGYVCVLGLEKFAVGMLFFAQAERLRHASAQAVLPEQMMATP